MRPLREDEPGTIGPYRPLAELGEGGMGRVLLAAARDGSLVALKVMRPHLIHDAQFRFRFRREVITSREVAASRWTAAVLDADEDAPEPWLASEFFHGPTLAEAIGAAGALDETAVRRLLHGLASALAEIHVLGVVHRDLKPSNVILTEDGVRLIDFGIARVPGSGGDTTITETGALIGAPAYMSPEQITRGAIGPESDVFSLGTTVIHAGTGASPFDAEILFDIMSKVVHGEPDLAAFPVGLRPLVEECVRKAPEARPTAAGLLARVGEPLAGPWPPSVAALDARQREEVAELARRNGWDTRVRADTTAFMYGPGFVAAEDTPSGSDGPTFAFGSEDPTFQYGPASDGNTRRYPGGGPHTPPPQDPPPADATPPRTASSKEAPPKSASSSEETPPKPPSTPPVAPRSKPEGANPYAVVAVVAVIAMALFLVLLDRDGEDPSTDRDTDPDTAEGTTASSPTEDWGYDEEEPRTEEATTEAEPEPDPIRDAALGDCFRDYGDLNDPDLESADCGAGVFEVVDLFHGTTDLDRCDGTPRLTRSVSYGAYDLVLCLSYTVIAGDDAYHAEVGDCVYGSSSPDSAWNLIDCQDGAFRVIERLDNESDIDSCTDSTYFNYGLAYTTNRTYLDVTLCMSMIYPAGDAGYAGKNDCMSMNSDYTYFEFVSDCSDGNVYITGRAGEVVDDPEGWCNGWGWHYQEITDFPELGYTICWGWL